MFRTIILLFLSAVLLACNSACSGGLSDAKTALESKGVLDVLKQAGNDVYDPPADGHLTEKQVQMYLKVRNRELELAKAAAEKIQAGSKKLDEAKEGGGLAAAWEGIKAAGSLGDLFTADIRAAQELGENTGEYLWVKGQVIAVNAAAVFQKSRDQLASTLSDQLERMKKMRDEATNEEQKKAYSAQIESLEQAIGRPDEGTDSDDAMAYNRELLGRFSETMNTLETELNKYRTFGGNQ